MNFSNETSSLLVFAVAALVALATTPAVAALARHWGIVDRPSPRKSHSAPVALLGGVSVLVALMAGATAAFLLSIPQEAQTPPPPNRAFLLGCALGTLILSIVGLWDDIRPMPVLGKLGAQLLAAASFVWFFGFRGTGQDVIWALAAIGWLVLVSNAYNLTDNMDGAAPGVGVVIAGCMVVLMGLGLIELCAIALAGALVGFLAFNRHPARVFLGDGGSLPIGFLLGALGIWLASSDGTHLPLATILIFGVPLLDTGLVVVSRLRRKMNPFSSPGRDHLSHRFVFLGLSVPRAVLVIWCLALAFGAAGVLTTRTGTIGALSIGVTVMLLCVAIIVGFERAAPTGLATAVETSLIAKGEPCQSPEDPSAVA